MMELCILTICIKICNRYTNTGQEHWNWYLWSYMMHAPADIIIKKLKCKLPLVMFLLAHDTEHEKKPYKYFIWYQVQKNDTHNILVMNHYVAPKKECMNHFVTVTCFPWKHPFSSHPFTSWKLEIEGDCLALLKKGNDTRMQHLSSFHSVLKRGSAKNRVMSCATAILLCVDRLD